MKPYSIILAFLVITLSLSLKGNASISIKNLKSSVKEHPYLPGKATALFSWQMQTGQRNQSQTAWQILVSENLGQLKASRAEVWDSGKISSSQSVLVPYLGPELKPARTYFWKVKVWNQDNQESAWSEIASFQTGLLSDADWAGAQWIGYRDFLPELKVVPGVHGDGDDLGNPVIINLFPDTATDPFWVFTFKYCANFNPLAR